MAAPHPTLDLTLRQEGSPQTKRGRPSPRQRTAPVPNPPGDQPWRVPVIAIEPNGPALIVPVSASPSIVASHSRVIGIGTFTIGGASCRERVCQYVEISVVAVSFKKKKKKQHKTTPAE